MKESHAALVVDDDPQVAASHARLLEDLGIEPTVELHPERAEEVLDENPAIELVLLDLHMPGMDGLELLRRLKTRRPDLGVIMATVVGDVEKAVEAIKGGAYNYLLKPLQPERLERVLESWFANRPRRLVDDPRFASFVTGYRCFEPIFERIRCFAEADVPILIEGETGTGKELVAQIVHSLSSRARQPFRAVNAAAIAPQLFESEIFGHQRGAFTGAVRDRAGFLEDAGEGTLFLDEIGELGQDLQAKLLRVLQDGKYCRVGETQEREVRARLLFATNVSLANEVQEKRFRADLYYRVASHVVVIPALRERPEDVELLAGYFLRKYASQYGREVATFTPEAMAALRKYSFPGNVRELEGIVSGAVLLERGPAIRPQALPAHLQFADAPTEDLESQRYRAVLRVLAECDGNQSKTAKKLGISRSTLHRLLRQVRPGGRNDECQASSTT